MGEGVLASVEIRVATPQNVETLASESQRRKGGTTHAEGTTDSAARARRGTHRGAIGSGAGIGRGHRHEGRVDPGADSPGVAARAGESATRAGAVSGTALRPAGWQARRGALRQAAGLDLPSRPEVRDRGAAAAQSPA